MTLKVGDPAPEFALPDQHGETVRLADLRGRRVVLYFYPKADTPGCTTQACSVRDARPDLDTAGAVVIGISPDEPATQARFDTKHGLAFPLLSDADHAVAEAYGVWGEKSMYGKKFMGIIRSVFVIDEAGRIVETLYKVSPKDTVPKALLALSS
ncbi:MAG: thioredoxin-dependent thiol peroxidase [Actinomycetota bacterium]|nr:thioredoxin-dependent thiol peroxidase [Actinomycetota bacterium]